MLKVVCVGKLINEPLKVEGVDGTLCKFKVVEKECFTDSNGKKPKQIITIICWNKLGDKCLKFLEKGNNISVTGNLQVRKHLNFEDNEICSLEIVAEEIEFIR